MELFTDNTFSFPVASNYVANTPDMINIGMKLAENKNFILQTKKCWATPRLVTTYSISQINKPFLALMRMMLFNTSFSMSFVQLRQRTSLRCTKTLSRPRLCFLFNPSHLRQTWKLKFTLLVRLVKKSHVEIKTLTNIDKSNNQYFVIWKQLNFMGFLPLILIKISLDKQSLKHFLTAKNVAENFCLLNLFYLRYLERKSYSVVFKYLL